MSTTAREAGQDGRAGGVTRAVGTGATIWFTGLSGAGKSTLAETLGRLLVEEGVVVTRLDGDDLREGLNADLGFSFEDRVENIRRTGEVARLFALAGNVTIVSLISPFREGRLQVRERHERSGLPFVLVHVSTPLEECERRDPKGLYARARRGEIERFTGVSDPYEAPATAEVVVDTEGQSPLESAAELLGALRALPLIQSGPML